VKVVLLAGASSIHTIRWANGLNAAGIEVHVISQHPPLEPMHQDVTLHLVPFRGVLGYFTMVPSVKKLLAKIKPDLVNAHYASGYATTAKLVAYHPWLLSVWGSDVYDFPNFSPLHKFWVNTNLHSADKIASTSLCMAKQTHNLTKGLGKIDITPFGVDVDYYKQKSTPLEIDKPKDQPFIIGTVKLMAHKYGIDTLIESFSVLRDRLMSSHPEVAKNLYLRLVGDGPQEKELASLARNLNVSDYVQFVGRVNHLDVPGELSKFDIYVALSRLDSESFGVAIVEASAANRPVVVSNVGGLPEVVVDGVTGMVVPKEDPQAAAKALESLVLDPVLRKNMADAGRKHVEENYNWESCVENMLHVYRNTISSYMK